MRPDYITVSLGLPEFHVLWTCESDSLVWIKVVKRNEFALCPECGRVTQHFHDERVDDVWDVPILEKGVKLLVVKQRWWCGTPGCEQITPFSEGFDSLDVGQHRTHRLNAYIYRLTKRMPNTEVVKELSHYHILISDCTVGRIQRVFAQQQVDQRPVRKRRVIAIDEFSIKKQHTYATVITDPIYKEVVDTFRKRDKDTVVAHLNQLPHKESIQVAVIDMSLASAADRPCPLCEGTRAVQQELDGGLESALHSYSSQKTTSAKSFRGLGGGSSSG